LNDHLTNISLDRHGSEVHLVTSWETTPGDVLKTVRGTSGHYIVLWTIPLHRKHGHIFYRSAYHVHFSSTKLRRLHKHFIHPSVNKLYDLIKRAKSNEVDEATKNILKYIQSSCTTCQRKSMKPRSFKPSFTISETDEHTFNKQIDIDVVWLNGPPALHVIDHDTNFSAEKFVNGESTEHIWQALLECWI
jgi:hypothetical protein